MKIVPKLAALLILPGLALAELPPSSPLLMLDTIQMQLSAKEWVKTETALIGVNINVTLRTGDLVKARSDIMTHLNKIAKGDWHLLEFSRSQDSSGLEKLYVQAQARVDQSVLTEIYHNATTVSEAGAKYEISSVEFKPSLEETEAVRSVVRDHLYQEVLNEIGRINKRYPGQKYSVNHLSFVEGDLSSLPRTYEAKTLNASVMPEATSVPLSVSNELILTAIVKLASNRQDGH